MVEKATLNARKEQKIQILNFEVTKLRWKRICSILGLSVRISEFEPSLRNPHYHLYIESMKVSWNWFFDPQIFATCCNSCEVLKSSRLMKNAYDYTKIDVCKLQGYRLSCAAKSASQLRSLFQRWDGDLPVSVFDHGIYKFGDITNMLWWLNFFMKL